MESNSRRQSFGGRRTSTSRSFSHSHTLPLVASSLTSSLGSSISSRKSRQAEPGTTDVPVEPASLSMPPPSKPLKCPRPSLPDTSRPSSTAETWNETAIDDHDESDSRSFSSFMASGKGLEPVPGQSEASLSNVTVTMSSSNPNPQGNGPQLAPQSQQQATPLDDAKKNATPKAENASPRPQPTRSRSRAKRRFSGSTANSIHSNSSERGAHGKEKEESKPAPYGIIGVCALDSKARSKPSRNILNRLVGNRDFDVVVFGDKTILDEEVEDWPICDYLISFYSDGFPLEKAIAYVKARKPFCVNDVPMQKILWDRRLCLRILDRIGVPTPKRLEVSRDGGPSLLTPDIAKHIKDVTGITLEPTDPSRAVVPRKVELLDDDDILSVDGTLLKKPFVEKPTSGEDHNIIIYFPKADGGGARKLFRKIGNKSSEFIPDLTVPRAITEPESSYLYEQFMTVENAEDVKAYTVGPNFCHAETRKSPVVDGVVRRNTHGKEIRYVTALSNEEKEIAKNISNTFGQRVCGFDFLRAEGKSYVIDVNGWSFVKDNEAYYDNCASILKEVFIKERNRRGGRTPPLPSPTASDTADPLAKGTGHAKDKEGQGQTLPSNPGKGPGQAGLPMAESKPTQEPSSGDEPSGATSPASRSDSTVLGLMSKLQNGIMTPLNNISTGGPSPSQPASVPAAHSDTPIAAAAATAATATAATATAATEDATPQEEMPPPPPPPKHSWKLKGLVSVIRHADRTPKQKYKFTFHTQPFIDLLKGHQEEVLLIGDAALASVIAAADVALRQGEEDQTKLRTLRNVLVKKGGWAGTKVQIKPMFRKRKTEENESSSTPMVTEDVKLEPESGLPSTDLEPEVENEMEADAPKDEDPAPSGEEKPRGTAKRSDSMSGVTMSKFTAAENSLVLDKLQLIVKWGGEPTHSARHQAIELAQNMRNDYLLLNREVLDEVHVYSSSERRVTASAQIWATTFMGKKGELPDDFITVRKDLLDDSNAAKDEMDKVKKKLKGLLRKGNERPSQFAWPDKMPEPFEVQARVVQLMQFHRRVMQHNYNKLQSGAVNSLNAISNPSSERLAGETPASSSSSSTLSQNNAVNGIQSRWCCGEDAELFRERWEKLFSEFCDHEKVDPSKISELYDTMKFDALHNRQFLEWVFTPPKHMLEEEYGITIGRDGKVTPRESEMADDKSDKAGATSPPSGGSERAEKSERAVRRLFRRRSWLRQPHEAAPEQYFLLQKGSSPTKAKTDAEFEPLRELYQLAKVLFDFICPQEYGISESEKVGRRPNGPKMESVTLANAFWQLEIGLLTSLPLLKEIVQDLEEMQQAEDAKSFFYFTKESHIYTLLNCILEGGVETKISRATIPELDYLSQICFELYESEIKPSPTSNSEVPQPQYAYSIRITISPGCHIYDPLDIQLDSKHCIGCAPRRSLTAHGDWKKVIETLRAKFHQ